MKLARKVALITGSGRGIGRAVALKLAAEGARVAVNDLDDGPARETVGLVEAAGGEAIACVGSVTDPAFPDRFVAAALERWNGIDIIVNNAGYTWDAVIQKMTDEQWDAILDVHLTAPFRLLRSASEFLRTAAKREAAAGAEVFRKVVNVSSVSGLSGNPGQVNYAAAKAGVVGLTRALAKEWGRYRVNVNAVAFGLIATRLTAAPADGGATIGIGGRQIRVGLNPRIVETMETLIPLGRAGTVEEAAGAVSLFCFPESNYITGEVVVCGGGYRM